jgi:hypothetical protein
MHTEQFDVGNKIESRSTGFLKHFYIKKGRDQLDRLNFSVKLKQGS